MILHEWSFHINFIEPKTCLLIKYEMIKSVRFCLSYDLLKVI